MIRELYIKVTILKDNAIPRVPFTISNALPVVIDSMYSNAPSELLPLLGILQMDAKLINDDNTMYMYPFHLGLYSIGGGGGGVVVAVLFDLFL
jgi:hypothetical protein